jgi:outer membrane protein W
MKHSILNQVSAAAQMVLVLVLVTLPGTAFADDDPWKFRFAVVSMNLSGGTFVVPETDERFSYQSSSGVGFAIDFEYRVSRRLGIDFGAISASPEFTVAVDAEPMSVTASGDIRITPIYAALNIHLIPDGRFDLYIGPLLAYVTYNSFELSAEPELRESFSAEEDIAIGAVLGLDIGLGSGPWSLTTAIRYLDSTLEASPTDGGDVGQSDIDPMIFSIGFGYQF